MTTTKTTPDLSISTTEHPNAKRLRDAFGSFARGDLEAVRANLTEDCVWYSPGRSHLAGVFRGWDEIQGLFLKLFTITDGTHRNDLVSVLADDTHAIAVYDATSTVAGSTLTSRFVMVEELAPDGRVSAVRMFAYDQDAADAHIGVPG